MSELVTGDGVRLFYERCGHGPRVYVCNGGPANDHRYLAEDLAPMAEALGVEFVFHDYRGSGRSATAAPETYTFERLAADLDELRAHLGDDAIVVLGHSMGGFVGLTYALQFPVRCERLILAGKFPSAVPREMLPPTLRALGLTRFTKMISRLVWWLLAWSWRPRTEQRKVRLYAVWSTMQEGREEHRRREAEREHRLGLPLANDNIRPLQTQFTHLSLTPRLRDVACPVLVLYGSRDAAAVWGAGCYRRGLRDASIVMLDEIGHDPFVEAPAASAAALGSFLSD